MSEDETPAVTPAEEPKTEPATEPAAETPAAVNPVERAEATVKAMKEEREKMEAIVKRQEEATSRQILAGHADAGQGPVQPKEETPEEYAKRVMAGNVQ